MTYDNIFAFGNLKIQKIITHNIDTRDPIGSKKQNKMPYPFNKIKFSSQMMPLFVNIFR